MKACWLMLLALCWAAPLLAQQPDSSGMAPAGPGTAGMPTAIDVRPDTAAHMRMAVIDSAGTDTAKAGRKSKLSFKPNPKRALWMSLCPGLGQLYNRRYWKAPIVWGVLATGLYFTISEHLNYLKYGEMYTRRIQDLYNQAAVAQATGGFGPSVTSDSQANQMRVDRDFHRRNRDLAAILTALGYGLSIVEAYVDAHLRPFTVSNDLSMGIRPSFWATGMQPSFGLKLSLSWH